MYDLNESSDIIFLFSLFSEMENVILHHTDFGLVSSMIIYEFLLSMYEIYFKFHKS